jgi:hypothetical protein
LKKFIYLMSNFENLTNQMSLAGRSSY